jgi:DNA repair exonuclease SbcCD ATPase subunit
MQNWIEAIRNCGLELQGEHTFKESWTLYETAHRWQGVILGHYLIIPSPTELFEAISTSYDSYHRFEDEVVSPFYFRLRGDWSWNLYIVFVVPDLNVLSADQLSLIQRGKRFGKKMILTFDQMTGKLPMAKIPEQIGGSAAGNPLLDWQKQLAPDGLLFCLDNFKNSSINGYLDADAHPVDVPMDTETEPAAAPPARPLGPIASMDFGDDFRPHVLADAPPLQFSKVNLLAGPNGMGKTSILEGIELAFTGSIQRNSLVERSETERWNGSIYFADEDNQAYSGVPTPEEKKQREITYYKHKVGPRGHSQLNSAFHQYNYFSSEAVHQFVFGAGNKVDYRSAFARVIFGEQLERYEQCWTQHLGVFQKKARDLSEENLKLSAAIQKKLAEGGQESELLQERARTQLKQIRDWMKRCLLSYPLPEEAANLASISQWLQPLKPLLHELDVVSAVFTTHTLAEVDSLGVLNQLEQAVSESLGECRTRYSDLQRQLLQIPDQAELEQLVQRKQDDFFALREKQHQFSLLSSRLKELSYLIDQRDSRRARQDIQETVMALESSVRLLSDIDNVYGHLAAHPLGDMDAATLRSRLNELEANHLLEHAKLEKAEEQISNLKERASKLQLLESDLKAAARQVIHMQPDHSHCPLCGHDHETAHLLEEAIHFRVQADGNELAQLLTDIEKLKHAIDRFGTERRQLQQKLTWQEQLMAARAYLLERDDIEETRILNSNADLFTVQQVLIRIRGQIGNQSSLLTDLRRQAQALDERGITITAISELEALLKDPRLAFFLHDKLADMDAGRVFEFVKLALDQMTNKTEVARKFYVDVSEQALRADKNRQSLSDQLAELTNQLQAFELQKQQIGLLRDTCFNLEQLNVRLPERQSWREWKLYHQKLLMAANELGQTLEPLVLVERMAQEVEKLSKELDDASVRLERCNRAIHVLSELRSLAAYGDDFVRSNFDAISRLFVALHSPNEFERLEWTAENTMLARRKGNGETCAIHQMSTGQRTSVSLAIFFIMHLVMDSAPRFLLLDEPVANMDELNVLGLIDFLRQLAITHGTQIFFTTANPQIATLFRRKFSFFEHEFRVIHLSRDVEGPVRFHIQHFTPEQEQSLSAAN